MIIKAITVPTPRRIKKKVKNFCAKERIAMYSLIGGGILTISLTDTELKSLSIGGLLYCGFTYEVIERTDPEILNMIYKNYISPYPRLY
ncbi:hypothetical protein [Clostridium sardiniense]|uniref:hypothetical protein n=1 Tax=Clostridium sardiniense TaxID=29369 RepID=UPI00195884E8|nr:hypothetical protein [Clostridium sardiniense]MBM7835532.1 hypothetical protein [Clostridium sardiniense]